jgi:hypothetical protein
LCEGRLSLFTTWVIIPFKEAKEKLLTHMCQKALALLEHFPSLESHIFFAVHTLLHPRNSYESLPAKQDSAF